MSCNTSIVAKITINNLEPPPRLRAQPALTRGMGQDRVGYRGLTGNLHIIAKKTMNVKNACEGAKGRGISILSEGYPPSPSCGQTNGCKHITSPRTTYARSNFNSCSVQTHDHKGGWYLRFVEGAADTVGGLIEAEAPDALVPSSRLRVEERWCTDSTRH